MSVSAQRWSWWFGVLLSGASGLLWVLASAPHDAWPLGWIAMVPVLWAVDRAPTRRAAMLCGWITGLVANFGGFFWITDMLIDFAYLPWPVALLGLLLLAGYQALVFLLAAGAVRAIRRTSRERRGTPLPMAVVAPLAMVTFEMIVPFMFPWYSAISQAWVPRVIQVAELTGPLGVTAILVATSGCIVDAMTESSVRRRVVPVLATLGAVALVLIYGSVRLGQVDRARAAAPKLDIGVVITNVPFHAQGTTAQQRSELVTALQRESAKLEASGAKLVMWPEASFPMRIPRNRAVPAHLFRQGFRVPLLFGALTGGRDEVDRPYNTALLLDENDALFRYDKNKLLMFGEYVPLLDTFPWLEPLVPASAGHLSRGQSVVTLPLVVDGTRYELGPMICYEDILPDFNRSLAELRPHLLVNITNDAWFGGAAEPWQHLALSVFRAVEMRTDLVRSVNNGVSAFVDSAGRLGNARLAIPPDVPVEGVDSIQGTVALIQGGNTFYCRFGDVFGYTCAIACLGLWLVWPRMQRRRKRRRGQRVAS